MSKYRTRQTQWQLEGAINSHESAIDDMKKLEKYSDAEKKAPWWKASYDRAKERLLAPEVYESYANLLEEKKKKLNNRIRVVHRCPTFIIEKNIFFSTGYNNNKVTLHLDNKKKRNRTNSEIIFKYTKLHENWWEKFPELYECIKCDFKITRDEVKAQYLMYNLGGKK